MIKYKWNEEVSEAYFWDFESKKEKLQVTTLKDRLKNPSFRRYENILKDLCEGLVMVMEQIEKRQAQYRSKK